MKHLTSLLLLVVTIFMATGCSSNLAQIPVGAVKEGVEIAVEDRKVEDFGSDLTIKTEILKKIVAELGTKILSIRVDAYEGRVMLTGVVDKKSTRNKASKLARSVKGIKRLYNEILISRNLGKGKGSVENFLSDTVIEGKIYAQLVKNKEISMTNYRWRCMHGRVFLLGRALSRHERSKAVKVIKGVTDVKSVKSHVIVRPKKKEIAG